MGTGICCVGETTNNTKNVSFHYIIINLDLRELHKFQILKPRQSLYTSKIHAFFPIHSTTPRFDDRSQKTPQYDPYSIGKSPRSVRSTPGTNTSPHSMNLGDSTPLYDEN